MSKSTKILIGVLTLLPIVGFIIYIWYFIQIMFTISENNGIAPNVNLFKDHFASIFIMLALIVLVSLGLLIFYIVHAVNNKALNSNERLMWILLFIFLPSIAFIIYWILRIWQDPRQELKTNEKYLDGQI